MPAPVSLTDTSGALAHPGLKVNDVSGAPFQHRPARDGPAVHGQAELRDRDLNGGAYRDPTVMSGGEELVAPPTENRGVQRLAQTSTGLRHGVEHGLDIRRRVGDLPKDLSRCRLLLERLS